MASIEVDAKDLLAATKGANERIPAAIERGLTIGGAIVEADVKRATPVKSGALRRSIGFKVEGTILEVGTLAADKPIVYAAQREFGGTISGRPNLAIPLPGSGLITAAGVGGIRARDVIANPGQFGFSGTFLSKSRRAIMGRREGKNGAIVALFALTPSVTQSGSHYLLPTALEDLPRVADAVSKAVDEALSA